MYSFIICWNDVICIKIKVFFMLLFKCYIIEMELKLFRFMYKVFCYCNFYLNNCLFKIKINLLNLKFIIKYNIIYKIYVLMLSN